MPNKYFIPILLTTLCLNNAVGVAIQNESTTELYKSSTFEYIEADGNIDETPASTEKIMDTELELEYTPRTLRRTLRTLQEEIVSAHNLGVTVQNSLSALIDRLASLKNNLSVTQNKINKLVKTPPKISIRRSGCKEYMALDNYFEDNFNFEDQQFQNIKLERKNGTLSYIEMHIAIKSFGNAYITLSPGPNKPKPGDDTFQIRIGNVHPKKTAQYTSLDRYFEFEYVIASEQTPGIISRHNYTAFSIIISDGTLKFTREGDEVPIITYTEKELFNVKYFSMGSRDLAVFLYDCPVNYVSNNMQRDL